MAIQVNGGGGGAGGDSTYTDTYANIPAANNDGDLFLPSDGFSAYRDTGTAWIPWGPMFPFTEPVNGDFAWVNQGGASVDATYGGIVISAPAAAAHNLRIRTKSAPTAPYTIVLDVMIRGQQGIEFGFGWRDSATSEIASMRAYVNATDRIYLKSGKWTNSTTYSGDYSSYGLIGTATVQWFKIEDDNTDRKLSYAYDGQTWEEFHTVARADFLNPDQVCFYLNSLTNNFLLYATVLSWKEG